MSLGGCPYPSIQAHRIPYMIKDNYRMPKPVHLDEEMWVKLWFIDVYQSCSECEPLMLSLGQKEIP